MRARAPAWVGALVAAVLAAAGARAQEPALEVRLGEALARARRDLAVAREEAEAARAEAASSGSAAEARRVAASARLEAARAARRGLTAREPSLREEGERLVVEAEGLESELSAARDALRRAALEGAATASDPAGRARYAGVAAACDDATREPADLAHALREAIASEAREARTPRLSGATLLVDGHGRLAGRLLRAGPGAWFLSREGLEAIGRPGRAGDERWLPCPDQGIAAAFAALDRGEREVELPFDPDRSYAPEPGVIARAAALVREGGLVMLPLGLLSATTLFVLVERLVARRRGLARARDLLARLDPARLREEGALGRALTRGFAGQRAEAALAARDAVLVELRARLWLLGTIAATAPFVGLLGTVIGIVRSFRDMARTGSSGFAVVAAGISEALVATAAGIVVAVVAVVAYNALQAGAARAAELVRERTEEALERGA